VHCWHCRPSACLWCQKCHTFAVGVAPLMLIAGVCVHAQWNANCVFSEGAIRNYQMVSSFGGTCTYLYCGGDQLAHLKFSLFTFSTTFSVCGIKSYGLQVMFMRKWKSHVIGLLGYISTCQTRMCSALLADCCITSVYSCFVCHTPLASYSLTILLQTCLIPSCTKILPRIYAELPSKIFK
jgi:hypothetical protein